MYTAEKHHQAKKMMKNHFVLIARCIKNFTDSSIQKIKFNKFWEKMYVSVVYGNPNGKIHLQNSAAVEQFWIHIDIYYKLLCIAFD